MILNIPKYDEIKIFNKSECNLIVKDFEKNKKHIKLSTDHGVEKISSYEIDFQYFSPNIKKLINKKIKNEILTITGGKSAMIFGVKYSLNTKNYMSPHYDCNSYSCVITLNNKFKGGGTSFPLSNKIIKTNVGYGILFKADKINSYHEAYPIKKGIRYVLVIRVEKQNIIGVLIKTLFLYFVDKFIQKFKKVILTD